MQNRTITICVYCYGPIKQADSPVIHVVVPLQPVSKRPLSVLARGHKSNPQSDCARRIEHDKEDLCHISEGGKRRTEFSPGIDGVGLGEMKPSLSASNGGQPQANNVMCPALIYGLRRDSPTLQSPYTLCFIPPSSNAGVKSIGQIRG